MFEKSQFIEALSDENLSEKLGEKILDILGSWVEDGVFDDTEKLEAQGLEQQLREACEQAFDLARGDIDAAAERYPGLANLAIAWLAVGGWVLALNIDQDKFDLNASAKNLVDSRAFCSIFRVVGLSSNLSLQNFVLPWVVATIINVQGLAQEGWIQALDSIEETEPDFVRAVIRLTGSLAQASDRARMPNMEDFLTQRETHKDKDHRKSYKDYQANLSSNFRKQKYLQYLGGLKDDKEGEAMLTLGDESLAISFKRGATLEIPRSEVRFISVGSRTERMHTGYSHSDYYYWTFDIVRATGAQWRLKKMIGSDKADSNPMREFLTSWLGDISSHYKVVASGSQEVSESGYRTRVSYGVWF